jgi:hypothetical protein
MTTIVTRQGKGSPLTWVEADANFTNLNSAKLESLSQDLNPSLGGNLEVGSHTIHSATGNVVVDDTLSAYALQIDIAQTIAPAVGQLSWDAANGTLQLGLLGGNVNLQIGQESVMYVYNASGSTLVDGEIVYVTGAQGNTLSVTRATAATEVGSSVTIGMVTEPIAAGGSGFITTNGLVNGLNTSGLTEGTAVWLSTTPGAYTVSKPTAPNQGVLVGYVVRAHATVGSIFVHIQNGYEIDELHNVLVTSVANGDVLKYDSTTGVWKNIPQTSLQTTLVQTPTYAANTTINWASGNIARITLTGNIAITNSGAYDGQKLLLELKQDGVGGRTVSFTSETRFGTDITSITLSSTANKIDKIGLIYNATDLKYDVIAFVKGF